MALNILMIGLENLNLKTNSMKTFEITMEELGSDGKVRTINQTAIAESQKQVIEFYGLNEPDILYYKIEEKE